MTVTNKQQKEQVDFSDLLLVLWKHKLILIVVVMVSAAASVYYAIKQPNIYRSEAVLLPSAEKSGLNIPGQLGGLAALAGVNLGGLGGSTDNTLLAMELIKSQDFISRFIERHQLLVPLMAARGWDLTNDNVVLDPEVYDEQNRQWVRKVAFPKKAQPSAFEAYKAFSEIFSISQDKLSRIISINVEHYSPNLAQQWLTLLIQDINEEIRLRDLKEAEHSIDYLQSQVSKTQLSEVKDTLYSLIEEQTKTVMLANVRREYVFKVVDPAAVPEEKVKPKRALIVVSSVMLSFMFACLLLMLRHFYKETRVSMESSE